MAEQSFLSKIHLEDGDQIQWYKEIDNQEVTATWHSNGRVDLFDRKDVSICDANFPSGNSR
jgi:hypothetical protein